MYDEIADTPLAENMEQDGDLYGNFDPVGEMDNEYHEGYSSDADDFESAALAADQEY
ncbi:hypothetical protein [Hymenobacter mucosus]|uniref:Uncharacterized protein n=1 Tax=Hymenobacter mucosus TaxID=1411120 RepID=A0A238ZXD7_9BACT|nr:hypothetical protein [Hymenobacter mucosus]SNR87661.1 hypothetical protein SAMN06269173_11032 [Hymenobacter mucosus]